MSSLTELHPHQLCFCFVLVLSSVVYMSIHLLMSSMLIDSSGSTIYSCYTLGATKCIHYTCSSGVSEGSNPKFNPILSKSGKEKTSQHCALKSINIKHSHLICPDPLQTTDTTLFQETNSFGHQPFLKAEPRVEDESAG